MHKEYHTCTWCSSALQFAWEHFVNLSTWVRKQEMQIWNWVAETNKSIRWVPMLHGFRAHIWMAQQNLQTISAEVMLKSSSAANFSSPISSQMHYWTYRNTQYERKNKQVLFAEVLFIFLKIRIADTPAQVRTLLLTLPWKWENNLFWVGGVLLFLAFWEATSTNVFFWFMHGVTSCYYSLDTVECIL